ncbi:MAG: phospholipase D-like domain-containing protein, partial [Candidatus Kariarchaeaceae archaeon]
MTLSPIFTPDNALEIHAAWLARANVTIEIQNQYIKQFDRDFDWANDPNPIVKELVAAAARGVLVRVQVNEAADTDGVETYLNQFDNIEVRWMGSSGSTPDNSYLTTTHNKLVIIDSKITLVSSINFSENAFKNNREAGMV